MSTVSFPTVDLNNCDKEWIHISGVIPPYSVLIALDTQGAMTHHSRNARKLLPYDLWSPVGTPQRRSRALLEADFGGNVASQVVKLMLQGVLLTSTSETPTVHPGAARSAT